MTQGDVTQLPETEKNDSVAVSRLRLLRCGAFTNYELALCFKERFAKVSQSKSAHVDT